MSSPRRRFTGVLALGLVVLLVLGGAGAWLVGLGRQGHRVSTRPRAAPNRDIEGFVPEAERFVEQHRGLLFTRPVQVTTLDDGAFRQRLRADESTDTADVERVAKVLRGLGLLAHD